MKYRVLITKTLDVPKNLYHDLLDSEEEAIKVSEEKLIGLDGDVAVVSQVAHGETKVIRTLERARKAS